MLPLLLHKVALQVTRLSHGCTERQTRICTHTHCCSKFRAPSLSRMFLDWRKLENPCRCRDIRQTPGPGIEPTPLLVCGDSVTSCLVWASRFHNLTSTDLGKAVHCCGLFCLIVALAFFPPAFLDFSSRHVEFIMASYLAGSGCVNTGVPNNANQACISFNSCWLAAEALSHQL